MCRLRYFEINVDPYSTTMRNFGSFSILIHSLCASLTSPATLEHLKFNISFEGNTNFFDYYGVFDDLHIGDVWSHLDSIITHPTGSRLQRVDIDIKYCFRYDNEPESYQLMEPFLDALPLLRQKGILFVTAKKG